MRWENGLNQTAGETWGEADESALEATVKCRGSAWCGHQIEGGRLVNTVRSYLISSTKVVMSTRRAEQHNSISSRKWNGGNRKSKSASWGSAPMSSEAKASVLPLQVQQFKNAKKTSVIQPDTTPSFAAVCPTAIGWLYAVNALECVAFSVGAWAQGSGCVLHSTGGGKVSQMPRWPNQVFWPLAQHGVAPGVSSFPHPERPGVCRS